jgi:hypothetical protein
VCVVAVLLLNLYLAFTYGLAYGMFRSRVLRDAQYASINNLHTGRPHPILASRVVQHPQSKDLILVLGLYIETCPVHTIVSL